MSWCEKVYLGATHDLEQVQGLPTMRRPETADGGAGVRGDVIAAYKLEDQGRKMNYRQNKKPDQDKLP